MKLEAALGTKLKQDLPPPPSADAKAVVESLRKNGSSLASVPPR